MITISFHCRNKSFTPTSFLYKALSSNPLEASPCIYRDSFGNYRTKKKHTQKMLKISVPHTDLQFCPCYCLEGITGRFCNPGNLGREGKQLVLTAAENARRGQTVQALLGISPATSPGRNSTEAKQITYKILSCSLLDKCFLRY